MTAGKIKVTEAAALLHVSDQFVRIGMQRGIEPSDRLRIVKDGKDLFVGYVGAYKLDSEKQLQDTFGSCEVKKFRAVPELRHKDWKKRGLASPLKPDETPDYYFTDLQSTL